MKNITKLCLSILLTGLLFSCEKNVSKVTLEGGTPPVLTASRTGNIPLTFATRANEALKLEWTNPQYMLSTGVSSHDVSYLLEMDTVGANFTNPDRLTLGLSKDMSISFTEEQLNDYLLNKLVLKPGMSHNLEIRVTSSLANNAVPLSSNKLGFTATPYALPPKVTPPPTGELYIVGNATPGGDATGWNNPVPVPQQKFTQVTPTLYTLTLNLNASKSYLFLPVNGSWDAKFGAIGGNGSNNPIEDDFKASGGDLISPSVGGLYKIDVDFQRGRFKLTKL